MYVSSLFTQSTAQGALDFKIATKKHLDTMKGKTSIN